MYLDAAGAVLVAALAGHHHSVTVQTGDTLSAIAAEPGVCGNAADYPGLAAASGIRNPDAIDAGQRITVNCTTAGPRSHWKRPRTVAYTIPAAPAYQGRHAATRAGDPFDGHHGDCGDGDGDGMDADCAVIFPQRYGHQGGGYRQAAATASYAGRHRAGYQAAGGSTSAPAGSFAACVIARESGGNSQVMNASGHYGLFQFSASTWAAYGGNPASFGHASAAEQWQVFNRAIAQGGQSNWSPYDGC